MTGIYLIELGKGKFQQIYLFYWYVIFQQLFFTLAAQIIQMV